MRVFISYAHDDSAHVERVRDFWLFLRANGIDARLDLPAEERRLDWSEWMTREIRDADRIVVVASPQYRRRGEGDAEPDEGRGAQWEARLIRERINADQRAGIELVLPVLLPDAGLDPVAGLPLWLSPTSATHYAVKDYTVHGAERLLRVLTGQPFEIEPALGKAPLLPPRDSDAAGAVGAAHGPDAVDGATRPALRTQLVIEARLSEDGQVVSAVSLGGSPLCQRQAPLPVEVAGVWGALRLPPLVAGERVAEAGRRLANALFDDATHAMLAGVADRLPPGDSIEVVLVADGPLMSLPVELLRLAGEGGELGPLGLQAGVSVLRRPLPAVPDGSEPTEPSESLPAPARLPGPLKVLAAVAAPDETRTDNAPLDVEAEMQAVLDAVGGMPGSPTAQVRILEVASIGQIRRALERDAFHVLHLSAHGSATTVELEDEDGNPVTVTAQDLMQVLRDAKWPVPLIVLSSSGGSASEAMAAGLVQRGAARVIAMLAPVTDGYATTLARHLYRELAARPDETVGQTLRRARRLAEEERARDDPKRVPLPEYGVATLLSVGADGPLVDPAAPAVPLRSTTQPGGGRSVRELTVGALIGRRAELRTAMRVLRRDPAAVREFGAAGGVVLTGIGGIGKTALAGRIIARLREDGWLIAVHEGRWNPTALIDATASAVAGAGAVNPAIAQAAGLLADPAADDGPKLAAVAYLLRSCRLLVLFDDFEQNLTSGGQNFVDPAADEIITALADAAESGALLITCRYPLPGPDRFLVEAPLPPLSPAELRRMFLRLPALADLDPADQRLLMRTIGGHPRLIEFTDALLRGGRSSLRHVQAKLRDLAAAHNIDVRQDLPVSHAVDQAMIFGSADILLGELLGLLTDRQAAILAQVAVCRAPMTLDDLAFTFNVVDGNGSTSTGFPGEDTVLAQRQVRADAAGLADLTLLSSGPDIAMHPWTAAMVTRRALDDPAQLAVLHERALAMRLRRFEQRRGAYDDLLDIPLHLAALGRYDDIAGIASQATRMLSGTLATAAYLAEVCPLIPADQWAWTVVADLEVQALLRAGNLTAATRQLEAIHRQVQSRVAADPANTQWQRDLSVSRNRLGEVAAATGDLEAARGHYQASLDIRTRLTAADPANTEWQRDLSISRNRLGDVAAATGDPEAARGHYQASLDIAERLAAANPANTQSQRDLLYMRKKLADLDDGGSAS